MYCGTQRLRQVRVVFGEERNMRREKGLQLCLCVGCFKFEVVSHWSGNFGGVKKENFGFKCVVSWSCRCCVVFCWRKAAFLLCFSFFCLSLCFSLFYFLSLTFQLWGFLLSTEWPHVVTVFLILSTVQWKKFNSNTIYTNRQKRLLFFSNFLVWSWSCNLHISCSCYCRPSFSVFENRTAASKRLG